MSRWAAAVMGLLAAQPLLAAPSEPTALFGINFSKGGDSLSVPMQIIILLTLMTLLPAIIMTITPFLRITIVLHFLRQALGTQSTPSNQVLIGIALRSEEHTSELQSHVNLVCRLLLEKK